MKLKTTIIGIIITILGLIMLWIGMPSLQLLGEAINYQQKSGYGFLSSRINEIIDYSIVAIIGIAFLLVGVAVSAYGALSSMKVKQ